MKTGEAELAQSSWVVEIDNEDSGVTFWCLSGRQAAHTRARLLSLDMSAFVHGNALLELNPNDTNARWVR